LDAAGTSIAASNDSVYFTGVFRSIAAVTRNQLAAVEASSGMLEPWNPASSGPLPTVGGHAPMAVHDGVVYLGGGPSMTIAGQTRVGLIAIDASTGAIKDWVSGANGSTAAIAFSGPLMYVGGLFTAIGGQPRNRVAALDPVTGAATPWNPDADAEVAAIAVSGDTVYLGGSFTSVGGQPRNGIAAVSASSGAVLPWMPMSGPVSLGRISALAATSSVVLVGGNSGLAILEPAH